MSVPFLVAQQMDSSPKVKEVSLVLTKVEVQDLIGKTQLSDDGTGSFGDVVTSDTMIIFADAAAGGNNEKILIPLCCHKNHWCRIVVDAPLKDACVYDLMFSSYNVSVRSIEEKLATKQPDYAPRKYCEHHYQGDLGVQVDSYNCGIIYSCHSGVQLHLGIKSMALPKCSASDYT
ncbi:hypothetical protein PC129_g22615 [Phytophthora cactorum]|uniref:Ubiquitin-like protease family profile domain-containing protein n=1 Tax=Phytophthora cactorum TaxID=29920 RepID=A0A8T1ALQ5_9STRA|nr:hypothetical protein PC112_g22322 [Phytophthora cactorum]KAG2875176.1 hypothetical protein PC114_g24882 [Phytophthora cactorum]KAG2881719.1 hypothetical protein PC115_g22140 [Phytophthora cactorum]KAG3142772.1 hypothetical protein C6341_g19321 [Phytophthora cactorum]KAG3204142.1 hypothetical protein PC129_g22615 [Phytophthora cactorum]